MEQGAVTEQWQGIPDFSRIATACGNFRFFSATLEAD
jgi:hypothetical protein